MELTKNAALRQGLVTLAVLAAMAIMILLPAGGDYFHTLTGDSISYQPGTVTRIVSEELNENTLADGQPLGKQVLEVRLKDGSLIQLVNYLTDIHNVLAKEGMKVLICVDAPEGAAPYYTLYNYNRTGPVLLITGFFLLLMLAVGGKRGLASALALAFSLVFLLRVTLPAIYAGYSPILLGILTVLASTAVTIFLLHGCTLRGGLAVAVTLAGECLACLIFLCFSRLLHLSGFQSSDAESLLVVAQHTGLRLSGVLFAATMIASLGAVMDVAVSLLSALWEVARTGETATTKSLIRSGFRIGRDMIGTMSNTLIFAFVGGSFTTILVLYSYGVKMAQLISSDYAALELAQGLCGTCAVILTVPIASLAAGLCFPKMKGSRHCRFTYRS